MLGVFGWSLTTAYWVVPQDDAQLIQKHLSCLGFSLVNQRKPSHFVCVESHLNGIEYWISYSGKGYCRYDFFLVT